MGKIGLVFFIRICEQCYGEHCNYKNYRNICGSKKILNLRRIYFDLTFVLEQRVQIFILLPSTFFDWMFILTFRSVAILEWLRVTPDFDPRPQISQTRLMVFCKTHSA